MTVLLVSRDSTPSVDTPARREVGVAQARRRLHRGRWRWVLGARCMIIAHVSVVCVILEVDTESDSVVHGEPTRLKPYTCSSGSGSNTASPRASLSIY